MNNVHSRPERLTRYPCAIGQLAYPVIFLATYFIVVRLGATVFGFQTETVYNYLGDLKNRAVGVLVAATVTSAILGWSVLASFASQRAFRCLGPASTQSGLVYGPLILLLPTYGIILLVGWRLFLGAGGAKICLEMLGPAFPIIIAFAPVVSHNVALGMALAMSRKAGRTGTDGEQSN